MSGFQLFQPREFHYVDAEAKLLDDVSVYIKTLEDKIKKAMAALDQGLPAYEVAKILHG